jgi:hypothetical protein
MGFQVGWVGIKTDSPEQVLNDLGLQRTENTENFPDYNMATISLQNGWFILHVNEFLSPLLEDDKLSKLSEQSEVVSCQVHERIMVSMVSCFSSGKKFFSSIHNAQLGLIHIEEHGDLPNIYNKVKAEAVVNQKNIDNMDFYFEIPVGFADEIVGFKHDKNFSNGQLFNEVLHHPKPKVNNSKPQPQEENTFTLSIVIEELKSMGYFSTLAMYFATIILCIIVGLGLLSLSFPPLIVPLVLAPLTYFAPFVFLKRVISFEHQAAVIRSTLISALCIIPYLVKVFT